MEPGRDDRPMRTAKHAHVSRNPGRVDDVRGSPVFPELALMRTGRMVCRRLDGKKPAGCGRHIHACCFVP